LYQWEKATKQKTDSSLPDPMSLTHQRQWTYVRQQREGLIWTSGSTLITCMHRCEWNLFVLLAATPTTLLRNDRWHSVNFPKGARAYARLFSLFNDLEDSTTSSKNSRCIDGTLAIPYNIVEMIPKRRYWTTLSKEAILITSNNIFVMDASVH
jgi:hypothetical protein